MDKKRLWFDLLGSGGGAYQFSAQYQAKIDRADALGITKPSMAWMIKEDIAVRAFVSSGKWDEADKIYQIANDGSKEYGELELKNPSANRLTEVANGGALVWESGLGTKSDGLAYYNPAFQLSGLTQYQQNDCFVGMVFHNPSADTNEFTGVRSGSTIRCVITPRNNSDNFSVILHSGTAVSVVGYTVSSGFNYYSGKRDVNDVTVRANAQTNTGSHASVGVPTHDYFVLAQNNGGTVTAGSQVTSPISFLCVGSKDLDGILDYVEDFFT